MGGGSKEQTSFFVRQALGQKSLSEENRKEAESVEAQDGAQTTAKCTKNPQQD